jgi:cobalt-zinc-cadmium efflux system outer membrane protein
VAEQEGQVAQVEIELRRMDIMLEVKEAYAVCLAAQARLALAVERERLGQLIYDTVDLKVKGGKAARLELSRTAIELTAVQLALKQAQLDQQHAMARLTSLWGGRAEEYGHVAGELVLPERPPRLDELFTLVPDTPDIRRLAAEEQLRCAKLALAQAADEADITWSGGLERFEETDSFGFKIGVSLPLHTKDRNRGAVREARAYLDQANDLREAQLREQIAQLTHLQGELETRHATAQTIEAELLPAAREALELMELGYRSGKFSLLDVLDAQRTLTEARSQQLDALAEYNLTALQLERIIAQPLSRLAQSTANPASAAPTTEALEAIKEGSL